MLDNRLLDRLFGADRDSRQPRAEREAGKPIARQPFDPSVQPYRALTAGIGRGTPARRAAALRVGESGRQLLQAGRYDEAVDRLQAALALEPNPYLYYYLALAHFHRGNHLASVEFLDAAHAWLSLDPEWMSAVGALREENARALEALAAEERKGASEPKPAATGASPSLNAAWRALLLGLGAIAVVCWLAFAGRRSPRGGSKSPGSVTAGSETKAAFFSRAADRAARAVAQLLRPQQSQRRRP